MGTPKVGTFIAVHADTFIGESIQFWEKVQERRIGKWHDQKLYNHIAGIVTIDNKLIVGEALAEGFTLTEFEKSRYFRKEVDFSYFKMYKDFTQYELDALAGMVLAAKGTPYDFAAIADQVDFATSGIWRGETGDHAKERLYCSEAWATFVNNLRKGIFPYPWLVNPQMYIENPNIIPDSINLAT